MRPVSRPVSRPRVRPNPCATTSTDLLRHDRTANKPCGGHTANGHAALPCEGGRRSPGRDSDLWPDSGPAGRPGSRRGGGARAGGGGSSRAAAAGRNGGARCGARPGRHAAGRGAAGRGGAGPGVGRHAAGRGGARPGVAGRGRAWGAMPQTGRRGRGARAPAHHHPRRHVSIDTGLDARPDRPVGAADGGLCRGTDVRLRGSLPECVPGVTPRRNPRSRAQQSPAGRRTRPAGVRGGDMSELSTFER
jgi:hypothetical protein